MPGQFLPFFEADRPGIKGLVADPIVSERGRSWSPALPKGRSRPDCPGTDVDPELSLADPDPLPHPAVMGRMGMVRTD